MFVCVLFLMVLAILACLCCPGCYLYKSTNAKKEEDESITVLAVKNEHGGEIRDARY